MMTGIIKGIKKATETQEVSDDPGDRFGLVCSGIGDSLWILVLEDVFLMLVPLLLLG